MPTRELNVLQLLKGEEVFVFVYGDESKEMLVEHIYSLASDPAVTLNWLDAQVLVQRLRNPPVGGGLCP